MTNDPPGGSESLDHRRLLSLINSMSDGVVAVDKDLVVALTNSAALNILDVNELRGKKLADILNLVDEKGTKVNIGHQIASAKHSLASRNWKLQYSDGSVINLAVSVSPVQLSFGTGTQGGWVVLMRDITAEKSLEDEREDFISVASHELRTPIAIAEGNISNVLLLSDHGGSQEEIRRALKAAHDQVVFLSSLINDLAMLSRADRGKTALTIEPFDAGELLQNLGNDYRDQADQKGLKLNVEVSEKPVILNSSQLYIREILQNFISNSLKYTDSGQISLSVKTSSGGAQFMVVDTGIGISKSEQAKLFSKFFRSDDWRVKKVSGTGLGLYVVGKLVRLLGGKIQLQSELNQGTSVQINIPDQKD